MVAVVAARFRQSSTRPWKQNCRQAARTAGATEGNRDENQYQTEIPKPRVERIELHIHVGRCKRCGQRVQGRHPRQTSDAVGSAASQLGARR